MPWEAEQGRARQKYRSRTFVVLVVWGPKRKECRDELMGKIS